MFGLADAGEGVQALPGRGGRKHQLVGGERLADIVRKNLAPRGESVGDALIATAVARFCEIRALARRQGVKKLPATSELVDWVRTLHWQGRKEDSLDPKALDALDTAVLFKLRADIDAYTAGKDEDGGGW